MRLTNEELLNKHPYWNTKRHDIGKIMYGDEPLIKWDEERYKEYQKPNNPLANIEAVDAYVYARYGTYYLYHTLVGSVCIAEDGRVLHGDINIHYRGCNSVTLNNMYGFNGLNILNLGQNVVGFCNAGGHGSPSNKFHTKEMDKERVEKIINQPMSDYGVGVQKFMEAIRELYYADTTNHIMNKTFELR